MNIIKIIGPDCARQQKINDLANESRRQGFTPLYYSSPDNKSSLIITDYTPNPNIMPPNYNHLADEIKPQNIIILRVGDELGYIARIGVLNILHQPHANSMNLGSEQSQKLFHYLDYLRSISVFNDSLPNLSLSLALQQNQNDCITVWKLKSLPIAQDPLLAEAHHTLIMSFLRANGIDHVRLTDRSEFVILDIFQWARAMLRLLPQPNPTILFSLKPKTSFEPTEIICPLTKTQMRNPVTAPDGYNYEQDAITQWLREGKQHSPVTGQMMPNLPLVPNHNLREYINSLTPSLFAPIASLKARAN